MISKVADLHDETYTLKEEFNNSCHLEVLWPDFRLLRALRTKCVEGALLSAHALPTLQ